MVIGGCTKGNTVANAKSSSLTKVELLHGQYKT